MCTINNECNTLGYTSSSGKYFEQAKHGHTIASSKHTCKVWLKKYLEVNAAKALVQYFSMCQRKQRRVSICPLYRHPVRANHKVTLVSSVKEKAEDRANPDIYEAKLLSKVQICDVLVEVFADDIQNAYKAQRGNNKVETDLDALTEKLA